MSKKPWLFVVVVASLSGIGLSSVTGVAGIGNSTQTYQTSGGMRSLIPFIPIFCIGISLAVLVVGSARDRFLSFCQSIFALVAALQGADTPEFKQYFFHTPDVFVLRKIAVAGLPCAALLIPILLRVQGSYRFFLFKIFLLFSCLAVAIGIFSLPDTTLLTIHLISIIFCLCSLAVGIVWVALTHKDGYAWSFVVVSCCILLVFALGDDAILSLVGTRDPTLSSIMMLIILLVCVRLSVMDQEMIHDTQKLERRHLLGLKSNLEQKIREACSEIALLNTRMVNLLDHLPEAILIIDSEARVIRYMAGSCHLFGWPPSDIVGRSIVSLLSTGWVDSFFRLLRRIENESCASWKDIKGFEMDIRNNRGMSVPVLCSIALIRENDVPYFQVLFRTLEDYRKQQHEAHQCKNRLSELENTFSLVEKHAQTGWYVISRSEGQSRWSPGLEALWGFHATLRPKGLRDFIERVIPPDRKNLKVLLDDPSWDDNRYTIRVRLDESEIATIELIFMRQRAADGTMLRETGIARCLFKQSVVSTADLVAEEDRQGNICEKKQSPADMGEGALSAMEKQETNGGVCLNILLVEDVEVNQQVAQMFLKREGHSVTIVDTGEKGVQEAAASDYDLILMDIRLPDIDGVEATQRIRALPDAIRSRVPIFALTANVFEDDVSRYRTVGMNGVIAKPIRMEPFRQTLKTVLEHRLYVNKPMKPHSVDFEGREQDAGPHLDEVFITDRLTALGKESFIAILELGRRSIESALSDVERALKQQQNDLLGQAGHRLAGAASNFGFIRLVHVGRDIENALMASRVQEALSLAHQCPDLWSKALAALDLWTQKQDLKSEDAKAPTTVS